MKVKIWPMYHPAASLHNPRLLATMLEDWENRPTYVPHDFRVVEQPPKLSGLVGFDTEQDGSGGL